MAEQDVIDTNEIAYKIARIWIDRPGRSGEQGWDLGDGTSGLCVAAQQLRDADRASSEVPSCEIRLELVDEGTGKKGSISISLTEGELFITVPKQ